MSILKGVAVFLLSSIFVMSLFMGITSYTIGDLLQKENLEDFIETGIAPDLIENQCSDFCSNNNSQTQNCFETCVEEIGNQTDYTIKNAIDNVYESEFYGVSINQITSILSQFVLFVAIVIASGAAIFFVSEEPLSTLGRSMLSVSVTLFITALSPNFILSLSNIPVNSIFSGYMSQGLELQMLFAIVLLAIAIFFLIANYLVGKRKAAKSKAKK
jgi:hypothetical protein